MIDLDAEVHRSVTGMPRTASTTLMDIFDTNPEVHSMSTSETAETLASVAQMFSSWPAQGRHNADPDAEKARRIAIAKATIEAPISLIPEKYVVDKTRVITKHALIMGELYERPRMVCMVRDLRGILGSLEGLFRKNPELFSAMFQGEQPTLDERLFKWLNPNGVVGSAAVNLRDAFMTTPENLFFMRYELWSYLPHPWIAAAADFLEIPDGQFSTIDIPQTATDLDATFMGQFPHWTPDLEPRSLEARPLGGWRDYFSQDMFTGISQMGEVAGIVNWYQGKFGWNCGAPLP